MTTKQTNQEKTKYNAPALEKGLDIIEALSEHVEGLTQGEIAKNLDRSQSEIYRMLSTLVRRGYVVRIPNSDLYSLSLRMFSLSLRHPPISRLLEYAVPLMRKFSTQSWQSCHLGVESVGDIVIIRSVEAPGNWGLRIKIGTTVGLANSGTGRVLSAFRSDRDIDELIKQHRPALGEPKLNYPEFMEHIKRIRNLGYEKMPSSTVIGVTNISFPIFDANQDAVAAITCPYIERIDNFKVPSIDEVTEMLKELIKEINGFYGDH